MEKGQKASNKKAKRVVKRPREEGVTGTGTEKHKDTDRQRRREKLIQLNDKYEKRDRKRNEFQKRDKERG